MFNTCIPDLSVARHTNNFKTYSGFIQTNNFQIPWLFLARSETHSLQWRHNGHNDVSNHQPHDCLLNYLFRPRSKKTSKLRVTGLCAGGIRRGSVNSPHKWSVTGKCFHLMRSSCWHRKTVQKSWQSLVGIRAFLYFSIVLSYTYSTALSSNKLETWLLEL